MTVTLRPAQVDDTARIVALWQESMELAGNYEAVFRMADNGAAVFTDFVAQCLQNPAQHAVLVADVNQCIAGYGIVVLQTTHPYFEPMPYAYITDLDIAAKFRRQGIGEQILAALKDWCVEKGVQRIEIGVSSRNPLASHFWSKQGFATYFETQYLQI